MRATERLTTTGEIELEGWGEAIRWEGRGKLTILEDDARILASECGGDDGGD